MGIRTQVLYIPEVVLPRCYIPFAVDHAQVIHNIHVFTDASERAYGSVVYLQSIDPDGNVHLAFLLACGSKKTTLNASVGTSVGNNGVINKRRY